MKPAGMFPQLTADGGHVPNGLEVVLVRSSRRRPTAADLRAAWRKRRAGRASPVLMVVTYYESGSGHGPGYEHAGGHGESARGGRVQSARGGHGQDYARGGMRVPERGGERAPVHGGMRASVCGPVGEQPAVHRSLEVERVERIADCALSEPNRHSAVRFLVSALPEADSPFPGLRNVGLLSTQELRYGVPERNDWSEAVGRAAPLCTLSGMKLVEALGFEVEMLDGKAWMLTDATEKRAVAVFCRDEEQFEAPSDRFAGTSPVSRGLAVADREKVNWVILTRASEIRLYAARRDTGVGRKGRAESFVEANLSLLPKAQAGYLPLLFSADALSPEGTFEDILEHSHRYAAELAKRLRERVYRETVPALSQAVADRMPPNPSREDLADAYEQVMVILFRLLFVAYAEDKDLLPYRTNGEFAEHSLSRLAQGLTEARLTGRLLATSEAQSVAASGEGRPLAGRATSGTPSVAALSEGRLLADSEDEPADPREGRLSSDGRTTSHDVNSTALWDNVVQLWDAVNNGKPDWGVPAYNGGMFSSERSVSPAGAAVAKMRLTDAEFTPALEALLIDKGREGLGPIDFRELSARDFGTIYEGLLESSLSLATEDLTLDAKGTYVPAKRGDEVEVPAGKVYLHNRSGVRKETGTYFTKPFAVEHLLDHALEPALDEHLKRLDELREADDEAALAEAFFDFRCADISMGSGHFLVAALDRIEARLSAWLTLNPLRAVTAELERLHRNAYKALGDLGSGVEIEFGSLLRRQVARHCIYGVDSNRIAVELARLAVWIHTFVPGLPLSFLDHNLVCGDSLTGVGGIDEIVSALDRDSDPEAPSLFREQIEGLLHRADHALRRLARTSDADKKEIEEARIAHRNALAAVSGARAVCDVITAHRAGVCGLPEKFDEGVFVGWRSSPEVEEAIQQFRPLHFPVVFPEVFLRDRPGFDCLLGNPPWEQVVANEKVWWGHHLPGIRGLSIKEKAQAIARFRIKRADLDALYCEAVIATDIMRYLLRETYKFMGSGHTDFHKAFCWRNWQLLNLSANLGLVMPRSVIQTKGSEKWRKQVLKSGIFLNVTTLVNNRKWIFDEVHAQYLVVLIALTRSKSSNQKIRLCGPFYNFEAFRNRSSNQGQLVPVADFITWSDDASFPQFPDHPEAIKVFQKMRKHPRFDLRPAASGQRPAASGQRPAASGQRPAASSRVGFYHNWRFRSVQGDFKAASSKYRLSVTSGSFARWRSFTPRQTRTNSFSILETPLSSGIRLRERQMQIRSGQRKNQP